MVENGTPDFLESACRPERPSLCSLALISAPDGIGDFMAEVSDVVRIRSSPNSAEFHAYRDAMPSDPRKVLWLNLEALMRRRWGEVNKRKLARSAEIGETTLKRVIAAGDSVGLDVIGRLASVFRVPVWCLLKPGAFDQQDADFSDTAHEIGRMFDALPTERQPRAYALIVQLLEFQNEGRREDSVLPSEAPTPAPSPAPQGKHPAKARR